MNIVKLIQKRPQDKTIIMGKILFGLMLFGVLLYNFFFDGTNNNTINDTTFYITLTSQAKIIITYIILAVGLFPAIMGVLNMCVMKKKYVRYLQIFTAFLLFYFSYLIKPVPNLDIDTLLFVAGFLPLFSGITGKCILSKCMKYGEKVTKIRV